MTPPSEQLNGILQPWADNRLVEAPETKILLDWVDTVAVPLVDEANQAEVARVDQLRDALSLFSNRVAVLEELDRRLPKFIYFSALR